MIMKYFCTVMIAIALVGCTATPPPTQKAQQSKVSPTRTLDMEALCKAQAAQRYNTGAQKIAVTWAVFTSFYAVKAAPGEV
ncbi:membrane protein [Salmonella enterica subsp. enterica serovar Enteritidis str. SA19940857]|nr:membrane protein [Salmonella enterica subsp. enterica serovar Enteritidis str. SA19940857]